MNRIKAKLERLGLPGIIGIGLLLFCLSFFFGNVQPLEDELASLDREQKRLSASLQTSPTRAQGVRALTLGATPELLKQLDAVARQYGILPGPASYQLKSGEGGRRFEISLPLKAPYPALRQYLHQALSLAPNATLDELSLQRAQATDPAVEVQLRFSFALAGAP